MTGYKTLNDLEFPEQYFEETNREIVRRTAKQWVKGILSGELVPTEKELQRGIQYHSLKTMMDNKVFGQGMKFGMAISLMRFCNMDVEDLINDTESSSSR